MAKHLSAADKEIVRKERRRKRAIILSIVFFVMLAAGAAEIIILKTMTSVDRRFIREVERGVAAGWESGKSDLQIKEQGSVTDTAFINAEYEAVRQFANKPFQDKELKNLAKRYINDLKKCRNAASAHDPVSDGDAFWDIFAEPYTDRLIALKRLYTGEYQMGSSWEDYPDLLDELMSRAWAAETIPQLEFTRADSKNGVGEFTAVLQNDSGFDIEYLNIDIEIYDSKDALAGTAEVIKENIDDGSSAELVFYFSDARVTSYRIAGVDCVAVRKVIIEDEAEDSEAVDEEDNDVDNDADIEEDGEEDNGTDSEEYIETGSGEETGE